MIPAAELVRRLREGGTGLLLLDARRRAAFGRDPLGIPGAIPVWMDEQPVRIPDCDRSREIVVYCVCDGQASSTRVAMWLRRAGYRRIWVLEGGLPAWRAAGFAQAPVSASARQALAWRDAPALEADAEVPVAERAWLADPDLPVRRWLAVLFVDIVDSTGLIERETPRDAFAAIQRVMEVVVEQGVAYCGDVRDFEGDGALLYFAGVGEALPAAFAIREHLDRRRAAGPPVPQVRMGLAVGELLAGYVGNAVRRSLLLLGPAVNTAARLQKVAPPGGIATTDEALRLAKVADPDLAAHFVPTSRLLQLKGIREPVAVHITAAGSGVS